MKIATIVTGNMARSLGILWAQRNSTNSTRAVIDINGTEQLI